MKKSGKIKQSGKIKDIVVALEGGLLEGEFAGELIIPKPERILGLIPVSIKFSFPYAAEEKIVQPIMKVFLNSLGDLIMLASCMMHDC